MIKQVKIFALFLIGIYLFGIVGVVGETPSANAPQPPTPLPSSGGAGAWYVDNKDSKKLTQEATSIDGTPNQVVQDIKDLKQASNSDLQKFWDNSQAYNSLKEQYMKDDPTGLVPKLDDGDKQRTAQRLTQTDEMKRLIKDASDQRLWDAIKKDKNPLAKETLEELFSKAKFEDGFDLSQSKFIEDGGQKYFDYGIPYESGGEITSQVDLRFFEDPKVNEITFGKDGFVKISGIENGQPFSLKFNGRQLQPLPPGTQTSPPGNLPQGPRGSQPPTGPGGPDDGCGGGGGGGGGGEPKIGDQAVQMAQQMAGLAAQLLGPLKDVLSSGKGNTKVSDSSGGDTEIALDNGAQAVVKSKEEEEKEVQLAQADTSKTAVATVDNNLNAELEGNNLMKISDVAVVAVPDGAAKTTVINDAETAGASKITAAVISADGDRQFVKFIKHDMEMSGERFLVLVLKDFNEVKGIGKNLNIRNGNTLIKFDNGKTLYPNEVRGVPYSMNKIQNKLDTERTFIIKEKSLGNYLVDDKKILTVGDDSVEIDGMIVAKSRKDMFKDMVVE